MVRKKKTYEPALRKSQAEMLRTKGFITVKEAADRCGVAGSTIYSWAADEKIVTKKVGSAVYVSLASLRGYLDMDL